jgi:hypothetical protein
MSWSSAIRRAVVWTRNSSVARLNDDLRSGTWCAGCPVARWCPAAKAPAALVIVVDGVTLDARTGEVISAPEGLTARAEAIADVAAEPVADDEAGT